MYDHTQYCMSLYMQPYSLKYLKVTDPQHIDLWQWPCSTVMKDEENMPNVLHRLMAVTGLQSCWKQNTIHLDICPCLLFISGISLCSVFILLSDSRSIIPSIRLDFSATAVNSNTALSAETRY